MNITRTHQRLTGFYFCYYLLKLVHIFELMNLYDDSSLFICVLIVENQLKVSKLGVYSCLGLCLMQNICVQL